MKNTLDQIIRKAMAHIITDMNGDGEATVNFVLGGLPWTVTVAIDSEKLEQPK